MTTAAGKQLLIDASWPAGHGVISSLTLKKNIQNKVETLIYQYDFLFEISSVTID